MAGVTTMATTIAANVTKVVNSTMSTLPTTTTTTLSTVKHLATTNATITATTTTANTTVSPSLSTSTTKMPLVTTTTMATTSTSAASTLPNIVTSTVSKLTTQLPLPDGSSSSLVFLSLVLFVVAVAIIAKIIYSNRKRRSDLIGGTARWRLAASQQSGAGPQQTAANYAPMGGARSATATNGLDTPGPDRLDWERQFFDDTEATVPSRLQLDLSRT
ncbi:hypothetical protein Q1695_005409 [Nippostrongylus brasiliensis]|nr:hypothetical protein Q1695_005409 [Nippostrongylus brasiliensis]